MVFTLECSVTRSLHQLFPSQPAAIQHSSHHHHHPKRHHRHGDHRWRQIVSSFVWMLGSSLYVCYFFNPARHPHLASRDHRAAHSYCVKLPTSPSPPPSVCVCVCVQASLGHHRVCSPPSEGGWGIGVSPPGRYGGSPVLGARPHDTGKPLSQVQGSAPPPRPALAGSPEKIKVADVCWRHWVRPAPSLPASLRTAPHRPPWLRRSPPYFPAPTLD